MSEFRIDKITNRDSSAGTQIAGITTFSGTSGVQLPSGPTEYRGGRGRGIIGGSYPANTTLINKIEIASTGNATSFGTLAHGHCWSYPSSSSTRGIFAGGYITPGSGVVSGIDYVTISSGGGGNDFGDLKTALKMGAGFSDSTRGIFATGSGASPNICTTKINFITIASTGSESSFGDALIARRGAKGFSSPTRGVFAQGGGETSPVSIDTKTIEYVTIQSKGNSVEFGERTINHMYQGAAASNTTRGLLAGGYNTGTSNKNVIDYVTIATTANAIDFGDLTVARHGGAGMSSATRAVFAGLWDGAATNVMDYVTIATTGNATDFGDSTAAVYYSDGVTDAHGGLG